MGLGDLLNLYRIQKLYKLFRKGVGNPALFKDKEYWLEVFKTAVTIREVKEMLSGYKTYIIAILLAAVTLAHSLGYINDQLYQALLALLSSGGLATVAAKMNGIKTDIKNNETNRIQTNTLNNLQK